MYMLVLPDLYIIKVSMCFIHCFVCNGSPDQSFSDHMLPASVCQSVCTIFIFLSSQKPHGQIWRKASLEERDSN